MSVCTNCLHEILCFSPVFSKYSTSQHWFIVDVTTDCKSTPQATPTGNADDLGRLTTRCIISEPSRYSRPWTWKRFSGIYTELLFFRFFSSLGSGVRSPANASRSAPMGLDLGIRTSNEFSRYLSVSSLSTEHMGALRPRHGDQDLPPRIFEDT